MQHSGMGIASFVISISVAILVFLVFAAAGAAEVSTPGGIDPESPMAVIVGLFIVSLILADLVALGLGIAGLVQKEKKRLFAVLGTVFSAATIAGTVLLIIAGILMEY